MTTEERLEAHLSKNPIIPDNAYVAKEATVIGNVTLGEHASIWPGCVVRGDINFIVIGMGATIMDGSVIGKNSIVGAGSLVTGGTQVPADSLVMGSPAKVVRPLTEKEQANIAPWAAKYIKVAAAHKQKFS